MSRRARVVAAYATVKVLDDATGKPTVHGFYQGAVFPQSADPEDVSRQVRRGYAEWVDGEPETAVEEPPAEESAKVEAKAPKAKAEA